LVPRAGSFSVSCTGRPSSFQTGIFTAPWSMLMKIARLALSWSWRSCGIVVGLADQTPRPAVSEPGRNLDSMTAMSRNVMESDDQLELIVADLDGEDLRPGGDLRDGGPRDVGEW
jgi:hypothetical protein